MPKKPKLKLSFEPGKMYMHESMGLLKVSGATDTMIGDAILQVITFISAEGALISIPENKASKVLRFVDPNEHKPEEIMAILKSDKKKMGQNWRDIQKKLKSRLESDDILEVARAVRDSAADAAGWSYVMRNMFQVACRRLIEELSLSLGQSPTEVAAQLKKELPWNLGIEYVPTARYAKPKLGIRGRNQTTLPL